MRTAMSLVDTSMRMLVSPRVASSKADFVPHMLALAGDLLAKAEPSMERFEQWPLPEAHPLVRGLAEVRLYMGKAAEMVPAAGSAGALNMDQLLDFLPAGGGSAGGKAAAGKAAGVAAGGAGKGKGKKKAGGKK
jgi:hypothetical protein